MANKWTSRSRVDSFHPIHFDTSIDSLTCLQRQAVKPCFGFSCQSLRIVLLSGLSIIQFRGLSRLGLFCLLVLSLMLSHDHREASVGCVAVAPDGREHAFLISKIVRLILSRGKLMVATQSGNEAFGDTVLLQMRIQRGVGEGRDEAWMWGNPVENDHLDIAMTFISIPPRVQAQQDNFHLESDHLLPLHQNVIRQGNYSCQ